MMKPEMKKLIIANLPYLLFVYLFGKLGQTYRLAAGADLSEKLLHLADGFSLAFESAAPSFHLFDLAVGVAGAVALRLMVYCKSKNAKKYRRGVEYGSARWGGPKDICQRITTMYKAFRFGKNGSWPPYLFPFLIVCHLPAKWQLVTIHNMQIGRCLPTARLLLLVPICALECHFIRYFKISSYLRKLFWRRSLLILFSRSAWMVLEF